MGIITGPTVEQRMAEAKAVIDETHAMLKDGRAYLGELPADFVPAPLPKPVIAPDPKVATLTIFAASEAYLAFIKKSHPYNTYKTYRAAVFKLLSFLERHKRRHLGFGEFESEDAAKFLKKLITVDGIGNRTRNNIKGHVTTFFNHYHALDKKLKKKVNPFEDLGKLPQVANKHQSYSKQQQEQYRKAAIELGHDYLLTFCRFMYYTLMRPHEELRRLQVRDIRIDTIYVSETNAKDNDGEYVDIPRPLEILIKQLNIRNYPGHYYVFTNEGVPGPQILGPKFFYRRHVKVLEKINLKGSGHDMYSWKHTGAIALWNATKDTELIRCQARHSDIKQTIEYLRDLGVRLASDGKIHRFPVF